jgi:hypothetical protein
MFALVQTLIGAAAAIVGGLVGAVWQTRRADDVARSIRRAERRENALLSLNAAVASILAELDPLYRQAEGGQTPFQYQEALRLVAELTSRWETESSAVIPDQDVINAYVDVRAAAHDGLPSGADFVRHMSDLQAADPEATKNFVRDLGRVLFLLGELKKVTQKRIDDVLTLSRHPA